MKSITVLFVFSLICLPFAQGQAASRFVCDGLMSITGGTETNLQWGLDPDIGKIVLESTLTPLWDVKVYDPSGVELVSGQVPGVVFHPDLSEFSEEHLEIVALILNLKVEELIAYQVYPLYHDDNEDGTGVYIFEFFKSSPDKKSMEPAGSVFFKGWGYGRCETVESNTLSSK